LLDTIRAKGKSNSSKIYELIWHKSLVSEPSLSLIRRFELSLWFYYGREFEKARASFYDIFVETGDKTSKIFAERCENYIKTPPSSDWDGVYVALEK
jgi:adenylate cyclase